MGIKHSPRTPYAPWTNGLVENQNKNLGTHLPVLQNSSNPFSEEQLIKDENHIFIHTNKETDIPSTIDYQQETFNQYSPFP